MAFHPNLRRATVAALWTGLAVAGLSAAGCSAAGKALGVSKVTPDEFRVVARAPLVVPPDYSLRPPTPGEPRPQELDPESQAHTALLGQLAPVQRTQGETLLVVPREGTISAWSSKATDIAKVCGLDAVRRIERGVTYTVIASQPLGPERLAALAPALFDRMTEMVLLGVLAMKAKDRRIEYDSAAGKFKNSEVANSLIETKYRDGWTL